MNEIIRKIDEAINILWQARMEPSGGVMVEAVDLLNKAKEIIQAEQKDVCHDTKDCEFKIDKFCELGSPCPHQSKPKNNGDLIRESNKSLAGFIYNITTSCIIGKCFECKLYIACEHADNTGDIEEWLSQPVDEHN